MNTLCYDASKFAAEGAEGSAAAAATSVAGAPPSNTAPANQFGSAFQVIRKGIDSLYLSYKGVLNEAWNRHPLERKQSAQSVTPEDRLQAQLSLCGHRFEVADKGRGRFSYVLRDNWFDIAIAAPTARGLPVAYVQIRNEPLILESFNTVCSDLGRIVGEIAQVEGEARVSRTDLCTDLRGVNREELERATWVCRARSRTKRYQDDLFTGWEFGLGGDVAARLYDKSQELKKSGKTYMYDAWAANGWRGEDDVFRLEFQLRRVALDELGVRVLSDLEPKCEALWRYCCESWLKPA